MFVIVIFIIGCCADLIYSQNVDLNVNYLEPGETYHYVPGSKRPGFFQSDVTIFCYRGTAKSLSSTFQTVQLQLEIENDDFTQYEGPTPEIVKEHHEEQKSIFSLNLFSYKKTRLKLNPFNQTCIGIDTLQPYKVRLHLIRVDFWKVLLLLIGLIGFSFATRLSQNAVFYYISGILLGIFASVMILIYLTGKLFPQRPMMYGILLGGWTIAIYVLQMFWENIQLILVTYQTYVLWYIFVTGFISFVICYRFGPPKNPRSKNLIKWGLQLASLMMIFLSSQFEEAAAAVITLTILFHYFPRSWLNYFKLFYIRKFPPKPRLLTNEEYYEQGVKETTKALEELREFCSSPKCKQWKTMTKLKDPLRFASFIEGSPHLMDEEILDYETSRQDFSDEEISEDEEEEVVITPSNTQRRSKEQNFRNGNSSLPEKGNQSYIKLTRESSMRTRTPNIVYRSYTREYSDED